MTRFVEVPGLDIEKLEPFQAHIVGQLSELAYEVGSGSKPIAHFEALGTPADARLVRRYLRLEKAAEKLCVVPGRLAVKSRVTTSDVVDGLVAIEVHLFAYSRFMRALAAVNKIEGKERDTLRGLLFGYGVNQVGGFWAKP